MQLNFSTDIAALCRTHAAGDFFFGHQRFRFDPGATGFSAANAWWLAQMSRWAYADATAMPFLLAAGHEKIAYFSAGGIHCTLVQAMDGRFATLAFRGTCSSQNWLSNVFAGPLRNNAHRGYENALDKVWPDVAAALAELECPLFFTGHSMGGALAALAARRHPPTGLYTFGAPPVGNQALVQQMAAVPAFRVVNFRDLVVRAPTRLVCTHVGDLIYLSWDHSLWHQPDGAALTQDQRRGTRPVTRALNQDKLLHLPEALSDHAPQNYVALLERLCWPSAASARHQAAGSQAIQGQPLSSF